MARTPLAACVSLALLASACARFDVRDLLPAVALREDDRVPPWQVLLVAPPVSYLGPPPGVDGSFLSLVPDPLMDLVRDTPLGSSAGLAPWPEWERAVRESDLAVAVITAAAGRAGRAPEGGRPWWVLTDEAAAMAQARAQGAAAVMVLRVAAGPDDGGRPWPGRVCLAADLAVLDPRAGETMARAYDRVSVPARAAGPRGLGQALRRAAWALGGRLGRSTGLSAGRAGGVEPGGVDAEDGEETMPPVTAPRR